MRRRNRYGKVGVLALVLLMGLALTGVGYGMWTDTVKINAGVEIGVRDDVLGVSLCATDPAVPPDPDTTILCFLNETSDKLPKPDQVEIHIHKAKLGVLYYCDFYIQNKGTIPTRVKSIQILTSSPEIGVQLSGSISLGTVIEPGHGETGTINVKLVDPQGEDLDYIVWVTILTQQWNFP